MSGVRTNVIASREITPHVTMIRGIQTRAPVRWSTRLLGTSNKQ